mgnify:CR=1 FL=1
MIAMTSAALYSERRPFQNGSTARTGRSAAECPVAAGPEASRGTAPSGRLLGRRTGAMGRAWRDRSHVLACSYEGAVRDGSQAFEADACMVGPEQAKKSPINTHSKAAQLQNLG